MIVLWIFLLIIYLVFYNQYKFTSKNIDEVKFSVNRFGDNLSSKRDMKWWKIFMKNVWETKYFETFGQFYIIYTNEEK